MGREARQGRICLQLSIRTPEVQHVSKQFPRYLRLVAETPLPMARADEDSATLERVCEAFSRATGLQLSYVPADAPSQPNLLWSAPVNTGVRVPPGLIRLSGCLDGASAGDAAKVNLTEARELAIAVTGIWTELLQTRCALRSREAELAVAVPVIEDRQEGQKLAARLESVLRGGAEAVNCHAAALYLLDDATSELKLRSSWGLPQRRLLQEPRPLHDQLADLEAMLGHAVVLEDPMMFGLWRVPEDCAACVCVPVSTPTIPLGTMWVFSELPRGFSDQETNLIEIVAGRLAADLEREALLGEAARKQRAEVHSAERQSFEVESPESSS
jgi:GAF domain-containing protein